MSKRGGPEGLAAALPLTKADFQSDQETRWCPGCGDYSVLAAIQGFMPELGIAPEKIVFVTGIGCAGRFAYYMNTYGMHAIHGRAPAIATGLAAARDDLSVWVVSGDGDALSIGTNHLVHALRRNIPVKILLFNNRIYGLTKGQASPTSEFGKVTKSTPTGSIDPPLDALSLALGAGATFVARTVDRDKKGLVDVLRAAAEHRGAAFVEVLQDCPVFNDGTFDHLTDRDQADANRIPLVDGEPIRFGMDHQLGVVRDDDGTLGIAPVAEVGTERLIVHDARCEDPSLAFALARLGVLGAGPLPLGVFRAVDAPPWGEGLVARLREARAQVGDADLEALLHAGDTWTIANR
jgi:2-oxoglutarate ferredoxin oxidoreductase subunit beta